MRSSSRSKCPEVRHLWKIAKVLRRDQVRSPLDAEHHPVSARAQSSRAGRRHCSGTKDPRCTRTSRPRRRCIACRSPSRPAAGFISVRSVKSTGVSGNTSIWAWEQDECLAQRRQSSRRNKQPLRVVEDGKLGAAVDDVGEQTRRLLRGVALGRSCKKCFASNMRLSCPRKADAARSWAVEHRGHGLTARHDRSVGVLRPSEARGGPRRTATAYRGV